MKPKYQDPKDKKSGVIYSFQSNHIVCGEDYIGETARDPWVEIQGAPQAALSHPCTHTTNRAQHYRHKFQHHRQGGPGAGQDHQGINLHKGKQSSFKSQHW